MNAPSETQVAYPASWWESRTVEQLNEYVRAGFISGDLFVEAQRELERRAREATRQATAAAEEENEHQALEGNRFALAAAIFFITAAFLLIWLLFLR